MWRGKVWQELTSFVSQFALFQVLPNGLNDIPNRRVRLDEIVVGALLFCRLDVFLLPEVAHYENREILELLLGPQRDEQVKAAARRQHDIQQDERRGFSPHLGKRNIP